MNGEGNGVTGVSWSGHGPRPSAACGCDRGSDQGYRLGRRCVALHASNMSIRRMSKTLCGHKTVTLCVCRLRVAAYTAEGNVSAEDRG